MEKKKKKKLTMKLPAGFVEAVRRRHHGRDLSKEEIMNFHINMQIAYHRYQVVKEKLDYCEGEWWDKMKIEEGQFSNPSRFSYAHRKRKKLMAEKKDLHRKMFYILLSADGNYEEFSEFHCIGVQEIFDDFYSKYKVV